MSARFGHDLLTSVLISLLGLATPIHALTRYIGSPSDSQTQAIARTCGALDQSNFNVGRCPSLLRCVLDKLPSDLAAGNSSGSNIASLVPTIAALIGAPPMDLVQMALLSPHRALATCCFSIGLPSGLFRQLKPMLPRLGDKIESEPRVRECIAAAGECGDRLEV
jgi:hypothetical protein